MWTTIIVNEGERALLYRSGRLVERLQPGKHRRFGSRSALRVETLRLSELVVPITDRLELLRVIPEDEAIRIEVPAHHAGLVRRRDAPARVLEAGSYLVWGGLGLTVEIVDLGPLRSTIPVEFARMASDAVHYEALVSPHERAVLAVNGEVHGVLEPGRHRLSPWNRKLRLTRVEMREQELQVTGQELVTRDRVSLRLNLIARYRVIDPARLVSALDSLRDAVYAVAQISARHVVAGVTVDELLDRRSELSTAMQDVVRERALEWGVQLQTLDIKDVILPGEMKSLMNQVIEAEKRAAAQVILRREEVAATRSLANTARMLEQNPVLLKLKELETYKELAERIPKLTVLVGAEGVARSLRFLEE